MNYSNFTKTTLVNGYGIRCVLWVTGCSHRCPGCQNEWSWNYEAGQEFTETTMKSIEATLNKPWIDGITFSGGDPLFVHNRETITNIVKLIKEKFPNKDIWIYTGYRWEEVKSLKMMRYVDVLVDGRFVEKLKSENYKYAGSTNQRIIDVQKSLKNNEVIEIKNK